MLSMSLCQATLFSYIHIYNEGELINEIDLCYAYILYTIYLYNIELFCYTLSQNHFHFKVFYINFVEFFLKIGNLEKFSSRHFI